MPSSSRQSTAFNRLVQQHKNVDTKRANQMLGVKGQQARDLSGKLTKIVEDKSRHGQLIGKNEKKEWKKIQREVQQEVAKEMGVDASSAKARRVAAEQVKGLKSAWSDSRDGSVRSTAKRGDSPIASRSGPSLSQVNQQASGLRDQATAPTVRGQKLSYTSGRGPRIK